MQYLKIDHAKYSFLVILLLLISSYFFLRDSYTGSFVLLVSLGITTTIFNILVLIDRYRKYTIADFLTIFYGLFLMYEVLMVLQTALYWLEPNKSLSIYYVKIENSTYLIAAILVATALIGLTVGERLCEKYLIPKVKFIKKTENFYNLNHIFVTGIVLMVVSLIMFFLVFHNLDTIKNLVLMSEMNRIRFLNQPSILHLPITITTVVALIFISYAFVNSKNLGVKIGSLIVAVIWVGIQLLLQTRLYLLMVVTGVFFLVCYKNHITKIKLKYFCLALILYLLFGIFNEYKMFLKGEINNYFRNNSITAPNAADVPPFQLVNFIQFNNFDNDGVYFSLLEYIQNPPQKYFGSTYLGAFLNLIPQRLLPYKKSISIENQFASYVYYKYKLYNQGFNYHPGWGFNPIAEALINFGYLGVFFVFVIFAFLFEGFNCLTQLSKFGILINCMLAQSLIFFIRADFASTLGIIFYESLFLFLGISIYKLLNYRYHYQTIKEH